MVSELGKADLLVELGVEEMPAPFLARALEVLPSVVAQLLDREKLAHGEVRVMGTPRRIAVLVDGVADGQPDETRSVTGPPEKVAVDPSTGGFTAAALKFAQKFGATGQDLVLVDGPKGRVVGLTVHEKGKSAAEVLGAIVPEIFGERSLPYPHSMRWCSSTGPFVRPVHWLVVLHGARIVAGQMFGIESGDRTAGHRFHDPGPHAIQDAASYEATLERAGVIVDPSRRREKLLRDLEACAAGANAAMVEDPELVDEVVYLTEMPVAILGGFPERFLSIPEPVVITAMAVHQRYFALRSLADGKLMPAFIAVANTRPADVGAVQRGFQRVLTARLEDARFCHDDDLSGKLSERVEKLHGMVYQAGLGSYLDKTRRLEVLCAVLRDLAGTEASPARDLAQAARLCKADLVTKVVFEFPELQGTMGGEYALAEGFSQDVALAIRDHYRPTGPLDALPSTEMGKLLALADKVDQLTGFFALGRRPRGGSDPFGLRRACLGMVRILLDLGKRVSVTSIVNAAFPGYSEYGLKVSREDLVAQILEFLDGRLRVLWSGEASGDILDACLACGVDDVVLARKRLLALAEFKTTEEFEDLAVAFKRAYRIVKDAGELPAGPDPALYVEDQEKDLHRAVVEVEPVVEKATADGDFTIAFNEFRKLRAPIDAFFEKVFVNVEDIAVRTNRLVMLSAVVRLIAPAARLDLVHFDRTKLESS